MVDEQSDQCVMYIPNFPLRRLLNRMLSMSHATCLMSLSLLFGAFLRQSEVEA